MKNVILVFLTVFPFINIFPQGNNILGMEVYYEFEGVGDSPNTNKYKVYLDAYIDCQINFSNTPNPNGTPVTVYHNDSLIHSYIELEYQSLDTLPFPEFECYTFPNDNCLRVLRYSGTIELLVTNGTYFFTTQTCCRHEDLINIFQTGPFGNIGTIGISTYFEITPLAQQIGNNSPKFGEFVQGYECKDLPIYYQIPVSDEDNHQLVFSLCSPFQATDGYLVTFPFELPPYPPVDYIFPEFSSQQPLGQSAELALDPNTGILTGIPKIEGKFVVGVCIQEYHNGQLLSTIIRDFQINVASCIPHAQVNIANATADTDNALVLNLCNTNEVTIQNESLDINLINQFYWIFNSPNNTDTIYDWHPTLSFSESGTYTGQLFLNPGEQCSDTADIIINVNTNLHADFEITYDTCIGGTVDFSNTSFSEGGDIINWEWDFGDNAQSQLETPQHLYQLPGIQETTLIITNEFGCKDTVTKTFEWLPAPPIIVVAPNTFAGCSPLSVFFENLSSPIDSTYEILWDFGNGDFSTAISPSYIYAADGIYDIEVSITSPIGCSIDTFFSEWITVDSPPVANFDWQPKAITNLSPEAIFTDLSNSASAWEWKVNEISESFSSQLNYTFPDTGLQSITIIVTDQYGCQDSLTQWLDVVPQTTYFLPNAFTPNQDSKNEMYIGKGVLDGVVDFQMNIWNRWGELVFTSSNPDIGWNGRHIKTGKSVQAGSYVCEVNFRTGRGKAFKVKKSLVLFR